MKARQSKPSTAHLRAEPPAALLTEAATGARAVRASAVGGRLAKVVLKVSRPAGHHLLDLLDLRARHRGQRRANRATHEANGVHRHLHGSDLVTLLARAKGV